MTKRLKAPALSTEAEFRATIDEIACLQNDIAKLVAARDGEVQNIQAAFAAEIDPLETAIDGLLALADTFGREYRAALIPKDRKSAETALATYGFRTGNPTVRFVSKKVDEATVVAALKANHLGAYVRTREEIAKDRILADVHDEKGIGHVLATDRASIVPLASVGLRIAQTETFYVEPKAESGEPVKAETK